MPVVHFINFLWQLLPGVQIFFIVSGFLITNAWLNRPTWGTYLQARALRILPALFVSTTTTLTLLWWFGYTAKAQWSQLVPWFLGQITTLYVYHTPKPLAPFAGDMPNASIWTLPIEVQFYLLLPALLLFAVRRRQLGIVVVAALMLLSAVLVAYDDFGLYRYIHHPDPRHTVLHHFWWFSLGLFARVYWLQMSHYLVGRASIWFALHTAVVIASVVIGQFPMQPIIIAISLAGLTVSVAFTVPWMATTILRHHDLSYGIYLFHRPFIHSAVAVGIVAWPGAVLVSATTLAAATVCWHLVEQPALQLKRRSHSR